MSSASQQTERAAEVVPLADAGQADNESSELAASIRQIASQEQERRELEKQKEMEAQREVARFD
ncbi:MAG: hypothetical protein AAF483_16830 [Planctomycetota bacterium]